MFDPDSLLLTSDVAKVFAVSSETVRQWERHGRLAATRTLGGTRLFPGSDVHELQRECVSSGSQQPVDSTVAGVGRV